MDTDACQVCGKDREWHREHQPAHAFSDDGQIVKRSHAQEAAPASQNRPQTQLQGDPVLRMALIRKGILTVEDLDQVDHELRTTGISHT